VRRIQDSYVSLQAVENYAWNIRVIKGQADLLLSARQECSEYLRQVCEWSDVLHVITHQGPTELAMVESTIHSIVVEMEKV
jgi:hypothetical protein